MVSNYDNARQDVGAAVRLFLASALGMFLFIFWEHFKEAF